MSHLSPATQINMLTRFLGFLASTRIVDSGLLDVRGGLYIGCAVEISKTVVFNVEI